MSNPARMGAVAAGHEVTAEAATRVLEDGGNAFDAAIAAVWTACVSEPVLASPGGGGFAMTRRAGETPILFDFFAQTPKARRAGNVGFREILADFGPATQAFHIGNGSSAAPGFVPGLLDVGEACASWPAADLLEPALQVARRGVVVTPFQNYLSHVIEPILTASAGARAVFAPDGHLIEAGDVFQNEGLVRFLADLQRNGRHAYDEGDIRAALLAGQAEGGHLTVDDLESYEVVQRRPLSVSFRDAEIHLNPPPSAGGLLIAHAIAALAGEDEVAAAQALDKVDRARRAAGSDLEALVEALGPPSYRGTTHVSVVDADGNACAITISNGEGNGEVVGDFGFMLNNMLGEEDVNPHGASEWPVDRRMSSMMCPSLVESPDGSILALGSGGSNRIRSAIFLVLLRLVVQRLSPEAAVTAARIHVERGHLDMEVALEPTVREALESAFPDHRPWLEPSMFFGGCHVAGIRDDGHFFGAGDSRRAGVFRAV